MVIRKPFGHIHSDTMVENILDKTYKVERFITLNVVKHKVVHYI